MDLKIMSIGDSNTEGVGVNNDETWPSQFSKLITNGVDHNFGMGGRSNDFIARCLITYYDLIKPDLVLIMYTSPQRRELYTKDGGIRAIHDNFTMGIY
jgi:lysophospholipase L1-like esterase